MMNMNMPPKNSAIRTTLYRNLINRFIFIYGCFVQ